MKRYQMIILGLAASVVAGSYGWARMKAEIGYPEDFEVAPIGAEDPATQRHLATREMIETSDQAAGTKANDFEAQANDGKMYRLSEIVKDGPAVLLFIKDGCPCSRSADPFFQRLHAAGRGFVPFFGVIDGGVMVADKWAEQNNSAFPILADPEMKIIQAFGAESSAYSAFVGRDGRIEKLWAGYSEQMLRELGERMAPWVKPGMEYFDVTDAPVELYAGCSY
ncbi:peroxiredoxin family protein [Tundrisphaera lichenicola]|uniref:peroxiredoxin family protein n=1 Tax=Tundrisphaera lichenicola TaxID=2029860 RepID=UPI003EBA0CFF